MLLQKQLVERLSAQDLDKEFLKNSSMSIAKTYGRGIKWYDSFPLGIKRIDTLEVRGRLAINNVGRIKELFLNKDLMDVRIFPRGIIAPEFLEIRAKFSHNLQR